MRFGFTFFLVSALAATLYIPAFAASAGDDPKVIYGTDDRLDVFEVTDPAILAAVDATCLIAGASELTDNGDGTFMLTTSPYIDPGSGLPPCESEPFADQPNAGFCTGWLADDDIIVTAGHCLVGPVTSLRFIFGFEMIDADTPNTVFDEEQIYSGAEVVSRSPGGTDQDHMVVRIDRAVTAPGATPLSFRTEGGIVLDTPIGVIGHPFALPTKVAFGAQTTVQDISDASFFLSNLDTYRGNSGSPVGRIVSTAKGGSEFFVEGVLVEGATDADIVGDCFVSNELSNTQAFEKSTRTTVFADAIISPLPPSCLALGPGTRSVSWPLGDGLLFSLAVALCVAVKRRGRASVR